MRYDSMTLTIMNTKEFTTTDIDDALPTPSDDSSALNPRKPEIFPMIKPNINDFVRPPTTS